VQGAAVCGANARRNLIDNKADLAIRTGQVCVERIPALLFLVNRTPIVFVNERQSLKRVKFLPMAKVKLLCSEVTSKLAVKFLFTTKVVERFEVKGIIPLRGAGRAALSGVGRAHVFGHS